MIGTNFRHVRLQHATVNNAIRRFSDLTSCQATNCTFQETDFSEARFTNSRLLRIEGSKSAFVNCDFTSAFLIGSNLNRTSLTGAQLRYADLSKVDLRGSTLLGVIFYQTNLEGTRFDNATIGGTVFASVELASARGLKHVMHESSSTIGLDSMTTSTPQLADFLRRTGVPEMVTSYFESLTKQPLEFGCCLVAHTPRDGQVAALLCRSLERRGLQCRQVSAESDAGLDEVLHLNDKVVALMPEFEDESGWFVRLLQSTVQKERKQSRKMLFSVRLYCRNQPKAEAMFDFRAWRDRNAYEVAMLGLAGALVQTDYRSVL